MVHQGKEEKLREMAMAALRKKFYERSGADLDALASFLSTQGFWKQFSLNALRKLSALMHFKHFSVDSTVITQGERGEAFFVCLSGKLDVHQ
eukprot:gene22774-27494_t